MIPRETGITLTKLVLYLIQRKFRITLIYINIGFNSGGNRMKFGITRIDLVLDLIQREIGITLTDLVLDLIENK